MKKNLIALVATAIMLGGERIIVQAGEPFPEPVKPSDRKEMLSTQVAVESADAPQAQAETAAPQSEPQAEPAASTPAPDKPPKTAPSAPPAKPKKR